MPNLPKLHPRHRIVAEARHELGMTVAKFVKEHDLTYGELFSILAVEMSTWAKYAIRDERHPEDSDKPGDVE